MPPQLLLQLIKLTIIPRALMGKCCMQDCTKKTAMIVGDCKHCQQQYCLKHRLPEDHTCVGLSKLCKEAHESNGARLIEQQVVRKKVEAI